MVEAATIADHINRQDIGKNHPFGLLRAADNIENGEVPDYPATLAQAIHTLGDYVQPQIVYLPAFGSLSDVWCRELPTSNVWHSPRHQSLVFFINFIGLRNRYISRLSRRIEVHCGRR